MTEVTTGLTMRQQLGAHGNTVDYTILNMKRLDRIEEFRVLEGIESDHMPLYNRLECKTKKQKGKKLKEVKKS